MGVISGTDENVVYDKFDVGRSMKLIRMVDKEAGMVLYTDTTRDGYTSVPISATNLSIAED